MMDESSDLTPTQPLPRSPELMRAADTALLVIDVQERLMPAIRDARRIVWNCRRLLDGARALGVACSMTEQNPAKLGPTAPELRGLAATVPKMAFSAGACGEVFADWRQRGIERALLCGVETHVCVMQTALDLLAAGYQVYVAVDAAGSRAERDHEVALRRMESSGVTLTSTEAALFEWCEQAGTPAFRTMSALVKEPPPESREHA